MAFLLLSVEYSWLVTLWFVPDCLSQADVVGKNYHCLFARCETTDGLKTWAISSVEEKAKSQRRA